MSNKTAPKGKNNGKIVLTGDDYVAIRSALIGAWNQATWDVSEEKRKIGGIYTREERAEFAQHAQDEADKLWDLIARLECK
jgi:hypothetical protein